MRLPLRLRPKVVTKTITPKGMFPEPSRQIQGADLERRLLWCGKPWERRGRVRPVRSRSNRLLYLRKRGNRCFQFIEKSGMMIGSSAKAESLMPTVSPQGRADGPRVAARRRIEGHLFGVASSLRAAGVGMLILAKSGEPCVGLDLSDGGTGVALTASGRFGARSGNAAGGAWCRQPSQSLAPPPCASIDISGWRVSTLCSNVAKRRWHGGDADQALALCGDDRLRTFPTIPRTSLQFTRGRT